MNDTSEADGDSDFNWPIHNSGPGKESRKMKRWFFLMAALNVLMLTALAWKLMKPDMSTYDGTAVLIAFLVFGFLTVSCLLSFVLLKLKHILMWMEDLKEAIEWLDQKTAAARYDTPDDDIFSGD